MTALPPSETRLAPGEALFRPVLHFLSGDVGAAIAAVLLALLILLALFGPFLWTVDPLSVDVFASLSAPSPEHPFGTDGIGRDVLSRFIAGARISFLVGTSVVLIAAVIGGLIGLTAGMARGWLDAVLMRAMDAILAFPPLILAMAVSVGLGVSLVSASIGIVITAVPYFARLIRAEVLRIRSLPFIEAAVAIGAPQPWIVLRHVLPHVASTLLIQAAALFGYTILTVAALGFVGLGAQIPTPEWGVMITEGLQYALTGQWWIGVFPGAGLLIAVTATSLLADRVRDVLDPRGHYAQL
jgi:peptide/nickel transport system permease protein